MTLDIEKMEALAKAATRGKWVVDGDVLRSAKDDLTIVSIGKVWLPKDSQFIAAAREAVPALLARVRELEADLKNIQQDLPYVMGWNAGFDHALKETLKLQFPKMLRKMWSGGEVQKWIDEAKATARRSLKGSET
jgi:hypothetical protein